MQNSDCKTAAKYSEALPAQPDNLLYPLDFDPFLFALESAPMLADFPVVPLVPSMHPDSLPISPVDAGEMALPFHNSNIPYTFTPFLEDFFTPPAPAQDLQLLPPADFSSPDYYATFGATAPTLLYPDALVSMDQVDCNRSPLESVMNRYTQTLSQNSSISPVLLQPLFSTPQLSTHQTSPPSPPLSEDSMSDTCSLDWISPATAISTSSIQFRERSASVNTTTPAASPLRSNRPRAHTLQDLSTPRVSNPKPKKSASVAAPRARGIGAGGGTKRHILSHANLAILVECFNAHRFLQPNQAKELGARVGMTETQVKIWFQNRRAYGRRKKGGARGAGKGDDEEDE